MNWAAKAEALGKVFPKSLLHPKATECLQASECAVGIACSGGADSVAAVLLVYCHFSRLKSRLSVLHFNHKLRGLESDDDEAFVAALAKELGLNFIQNEWSDRVIANQVSEADAREARQAFFDSYREFPWTSADCDGTSSG